MKRNNRGFTLMEMLIVVAIIAILIAIAVPAISSALSKAKEATCAANRRSLQTQLVGEQISMDGKTLQDVWNGAGAENQKEWREKYICPAGGTITVNKNGIICSKHGSSGANEDNRTQEETVLNNFFAVIDAQTGWKNNDTMRNNLYDSKYAESGWPAITIGDYTYYMQPAYNNKTGNTVLFATEKQFKNTYWMARAIYSQEDGVWYTGKETISVTHNNWTDWNSIKTLMNEKGWEPVK